MDGIEMRLDTQCITRISRKGMIKFDVPVVSSGLRTVLNDNQL